MSRRRVVFVDGRVEDGGVAIGCVGDGPGTGAERHRRDGRTAADGEADGRAADGRRAPQDSRTSEGRG